MPFGSDHWQLHATPTWPAYAPRADLHWSKIDNPRWRLAAKEVTLCMLQPRLARQLRLPRARQKPYPPWALPYQRLSYWRRWFAYLTANGHTTLRTVTQPVCDGFLATIPPKSRHIAIGAIRAFSDYEAAITYDRFSLGFRPWGKQSASAASEQPNLGQRENLTPAIPDQVFAPLLDACFTLIDHVYEDLRSAEETYAALLSTKHLGRGRHSGLDAALDSYLEDMRRRRQPLPKLRTATGRSHPINLALVARHIGLRDSKTLLTGARWGKLTSAADELGLADGGVAPASGRTSFHPTDFEKVRRLIRTACGIIVAALSGLRHSELAAIEPGSARREVLHGGVVRYRLHSTLLKGEAPGGRREIWTVIEPVVTALRISEELVPDQRPVLVADFAGRYSALLDWVEEAGRAYDLRPIPRTWQLIPRQFRRTLAREIARRPDGVIAGKVHLKHISVAVTEGYAGARGESANSFLAEIEAERREVAREDIKEVVDAVRRGEAIAGLGTRALLAAVSSLPDVGTGASVREHDDAVAAFVSLRAETFHPMPLAHCWFLHPEQARCLRNVSDKSRPLVGACEPGKCPQATIHQKHVPVWLSGLESLKSTLRDRRVPKGERTRIQGKIAEMEAVVQPLLNPEVE